MANLSIVIVPAKKLSNGRHRVRIAVAHRSQTRYISTQFILDSANQMKNGRVVKHENAANINACLRKLINEYEEILSSIHYQSNISCTEFIIRKSKFPQNPKRSVRFSGKRTKRSVQKRKARNTQKAETKVL